MPTKAKDAPAAAALVQNKMHVDVIKQYPGPIQVSK